MSSPSKPRPTAGMALKPNHNHVDGGGMSLTSVVGGFRSLKLSQLNIAEVNFFDCKTTWASFETNMLGFPT